MTRTWNLRSDSVERLLGAEENSGGVTTVIEIVRDVLCDPSELVLTAVLSSEAVLEVGKKIFRGLLQVLEDHSLRDFSKSGK